VSNSTPPPTWGPFEISGPAPSPAPTPGAAPVAPPFVPTFIVPAVTNSQTGQSTGLNPMYFATEATAQYMAETFGNGQIKAENPYGTGPYSANAEQYFYQTPRGQWRIAGLDAWTYVRMPEAQWPGLAAQQIREAIADSGG